MKISDRTQTIRNLNDHFRTTLKGGTVLLTSGVIALGRKQQDKIITAIRHFDDFSTDNPTANMISAR